MPWGKWLFSGRYKNIRLSGLRVLWVLLLAEPPREGTASLISWSQLADSTRGPGGAGGKGPSGVAGDRHLDEMGHGVESMWQHRGGEA